MTLAFIAVILGLVLLVWSADRFVEGAAATARYFGMPSLLIGMVVVGFGIMLWLILGNPIPLDNSEIIYILLGTLAAAFTQVCNFWLGSSRSSQEKTSQITELKR